MVDEAAHAVAVAVARVVAHSAARVVVVAVDVAVVIVVTLEEHLAVTGPHAAAAAPSTPTTRVHSLPSGRRMHACISHHNILGCFEL